MFGDPDFFEEYYDDLYEDDLFQNEFFDAFNEFEDEDDWKFEPKDFQDEIGEWKEKNLDVEGLEPEEPDFLKQVKIEESFVAPSKPKFASNGDFAFVFSSPINLVTP